MPQKIMIGEGELLRAPDQKFEYKLQFVFTVNTEEGQEEVVVEQEEVSEAGSRRSKFTKDYLVAILENRGYNPDDVVDVEGRIIQNQDIIRAQS